MHFRSLCCALIFMLSLLQPGTAQAQSEAPADDLNAFYQSVMAALASEPRPSFSIEAEALIAYTVSDDGSIESINVARSSGSNPLDVAALELVQNAAPFPAPPEGANRNLSITIKSTRPVLGFGNLDRLRQ
ncbi:MAG: TonB family protein [Pseudomonadota bacterium]